MAKNTGNQTISTTKEDNTMIFENMNYRQLQLFAKENGLNVRLAGKGVTKDVLLKSIKEAMEAKNEVVEEVETVEEVTAEETVKEETAIIPCHTEKTEEDILDGEYRKIGLAEAIYNTIWRVLPEREQDILDMVTIILGFLIMVVTEAVDIVHTMMVVTIIPWAKPYIVRFINYTPIAWGVITTTVVDITVTLILEVISGWEMRKELIKNH